MIYFLAMPTPLKKLSRSSTSKSIEKRLFGRLSLKWDPAFIPNVVICLGVVFARRGMRNIVDTYFFPETPMISNLLSVFLGIFLLYLPDNSFSQLWWYEPPELVAVEKPLKQSLKKQNKAKEMLVVEDAGIISPLLVSQQEVHKARQMKKKKEKHKKHK